MKIDWTTLAAMMTSFSGMGLFAIFVINAVVEKRLTVFLKDLNGTYLQTKIANERFEGMERRFLEVEKHFDYLRDQRESDFSAGHHPTVLPAKLSV